MADMCPSVKTLNWAILANSQSVGFYKWNVIRVQMINCTHSDTCNWLRQSRIWNGITYLIMLPSRYRVRSPKYAYCLTRLARPRMVGRRMRLCKGRRTLDGTTRFQKRQSQLGRLLDAIYSATPLREPAQQSRTQVCDKAHMEQF